MVVLPTALGKTYIAMLLIAEKMEQTNGFCLFLAPTKPLCEQHLERFHKYLEANAKIVTGELYKPEDRWAVWNSPTDVFVATPQTVSRDLEQDRLGLKNCFLIVYDEAHRAVGGYAYVPINQTYFETAKNPQILGLTASPGKDFEKLKEIAENLKLTNISIRKETDEDVKPYVGQKNLQKIELEKSEAISRAESLIDDMTDHVIDEGRLLSFTDAPYLDSSNASIKHLKKIRQRIQRRLKKVKRGFLYRSISMVAAALKLVHLKGIATTQGPEVALAYIEKLRKDDTRAADRILNYRRFHEIVSNLRRAENPKLKKTVKILDEHFLFNKGRAIVFANYRDTVKFLEEELNKHSFIDAKQFIGQRGSEGMSQKEQKETLHRFEKGEFNTLVSTSIGEEGIDIPATSLVIFYEPVPRDIRRIQREGRTARDGRSGEIKVLVMRDTKDEWSYEKSMEDGGKKYEAAYKLKRRLDLKRFWAGLEFGED